MILAVGLDLCDVARMQRALETPAFLARYFTESERAYILARGKSAAESLAGHFAAKEAGLKALGCGIALPMTDIAVDHDPMGAPYFKLSGKAQALYAEQGGCALHLSITHTDTIAAAVAILEGGANNTP